MIEELLAAWDEDMTAVLVDPQPVAADPGHPLAAEVSTNFTEDSPFIDDLGTYLTDVYVDRDIGVRPGPDGLARRTTLTHFTQASGERPDFVSFVFCMYHDGEAFRLSSSERLDASPEVTVGAGEAFRVDGRWRLHDLYQLGHQPASEGAGNECIGPAPETEG